MRVFIRPTGAPMGVGMTLGFGPNGSAASLDTAPVADAFANGDYVLVQRAGALSKILLDPPDISGSCGGNAMLYAVATMLIALGLAKGTVTA